MVIELDEQIWQQEACGPCEPGGLVQPDWHGLQARMLATREAGRAFIAGGSTGQSGRSGSFAGSAALRINAFGRHSAFVNPNNSANLNAGGANKVFVADEITSGDRG